MSNLSFKKRMKKDRNRQKSNSERGVLVFMLFILYLTVFIFQLWFLFLLNLKMNTCFEKIVYYCSTSSLTLPMGDKIKLMTPYLFQIGNMRVVSAERNKSTCHSYPLAHYFSALCPREICGCLIFIHFLSAAVPRWRSWEVMTAWEPQRPVRNTKVENSSPALWLNLT